MMHVISFDMPFSSEVNCVVAPSSVSRRQITSRLFVISRMYRFPSELYRMRLSPDSVHVPRFSVSVTESTLVGVICT